MIWRERSGSVWVEKAFHWCFTSRGNKHSHSGRIDREQEETDLTLGSDSHHNFTREQQTARSDRRQTYLLLGNAGWRGGAGGRFWPSVHSPPAWRRRSPACARDGLSSFSFCCQLHNEEKTSITIKESIMVYTAEWKQIYLIRVSRVEWFVRVSPNTWTNGILTYNIFHILQANTISSTYCIGQSHPRSQTWWSPRWRPPGWQCPKPRRRDHPPLHYWPAALLPGETSLRQQRHRHAETHKYEERAEVT